MICRNTIFCFTRKLSWKYCVEMSTEILWHWLVGGSGRDLEILLAIVWSWFCRISIFTWNTRELSWKYCVYMSTEILWHWLVGGKRARLGNPTCRLFLRLRLTHRLAALGKYSGYLRTSWNIENLKKKIHKRYIKILENYLGHPSEAINPLKIWFLKILAIGSWTRSIFNMLSLFFDCYILQDQPPLISEPTW